MGSDGEKRLRRKGDKAMIALEKRKEFVARFRYPDPDGIGPKEVWKTILASSLKEATQIGRGLAGREDDMKWFMGIDGYLTGLHRKGELKSGLWG